MVEQYRFDDACETVYKISEDGSAYIFFASYYAAGVTRQMSEDEAIEALGAVDV